MVGKRAKASGGGGGGSGAKSMAEYIADEKNQGEKVLQYGGVGFIFDDPKLQKQELIALAASNPRAKNPVNHYILAWKEGEQPTVKQVDQAVQITLDEMGMQGHQAIYCVHNDTDNIHLHLLINRIDPETEKSIEINKGFDREALHKAIARIEHAQGWEREANGRYRVAEDGQVVRSNSRDRETKKPQQRAIDFEQRTGEKSAQRIGIEEAAAVMKNAKTWQQLHQGLGEIGIEYQKKGSGAILIVGGETAIKPSSVDRAASIGNLRKRLGEYEPSSGYPIAPRQPVPLTPSPMLSVYIETRRADLDKREAAAQALQEKADVAAEELADQQMAERQEVLGSRWNGRGNFWEGKGELLNALRSVLADEQRDDREKLQEQFDLECKLSRVSSPTPDFEQWLRSQDRSDLADGWRYRNHAGELRTPPAETGQLDNSPRGIAAYVSHFQEICDRHHGAQVDLSRVDSEIAVKMRMTGHTQSEIEQILVQCAQAVREATEERDWQQYAGRVARFAFGAGGDRRVVELGGQVDHGRSLEKEISRNESKSYGQRF